MLLYILSYNNCFSKSRLHQSRVVYALDHLCRIQQVRQQELAIRHVVDIRAPHCFFIILRHTTDNMALDQTFLSFVERDLNQPSLIQQLSSLTPGFSR